MRFMSVDLPEPDGPTMATNSPVLHLEVDALERLDLDLAGVVDLADGLHADDRAASREASFIRSVSVAAGSIDAARRAGK